MAHGELTVARDDAGDTLANVLALHPDATVQARVAPADASGEEYTVVWSTVDRGAQERSRTAGDV